MPPGHQRQIADVIVMGVPRGNGADAVEARPLEALLDGQRVGFQRAEQDLNVAGI